jgi:hypothetical protein
MKDNRIDKEFYDLSKKMFDHVQRINARTKTMTEEDEAFAEIERKQQVEKDMALRHHASNRACEVMRELNIAELSQMTMLRVFALGYRAAVLDEQRKRNGN